MTIQTWIDGHGNMGVTDEASYRKAHAAHIQQKYEKPVVEVDTPVTAYINHSRWVVACECNGGCLTHPEHPIAACFDCGRIYTAVQFLQTDARQKIENILLERAEDRMRNWTDETPEQLLDEREGDS